MPIDDRPPAVGNPLLMNKVNDVNKMNKESASMRRSAPSLGLALLLGCAVLVGGQGLAQAEPAKPRPNQRVWSISDFNRVELISRESGAEPNRQPVQVPADTLMQQLAQIRFVDSKGPQPLFSPEELADLVPALAQALGRAGPGDDLLLLSSARRSTGLLPTRSAITARLFVQGDNLQFIAHDARYEFFPYRGTQADTSFTFGSRHSKGAAVLQSDLATNRRADWLSISLQAMPPAPPSAAPAPVAAPATAPAAASPAPVARKPVTPSESADIEQRLETLKRLRDKNLISEDEYQQKRKEILQLL